MSFEKKVVSSSFSINLVQLMLRRFKTIEEAKGNPRKYLILCGNKKNDVDIVCMHI